MIIFKIYLNLLKIKGKKRGILVLLNHGPGWIKPGVKERGLVETFWRKGSVPSLTLIEPFRSSTSSKPLTPNNKTYKYPLLTHFPIHSSLIFQLLFLLSITNLRYPPTLSLYVFVFLMRFSVLSFFLLLTKCN